MRSDTAAHTGQGETSSFSIADRFGNLVSVTHSVNGTFGNGMVVAGGGFVLNNRLPCFYLDDGNVNLLDPGKRTRHTISPALALKDGKPFLAWNTPGGDNQPQAMLQAFLNVVEFGMNVQQAVEAPTVTSTSFHESVYPHPIAGTLIVPKVLADRAGADLAAKGHRVVVTPLQKPYGQQPSGAGAVKMVRIDPRTGVFAAGVSPAKDDYAIGW
jgi:gamma-glutamyltranspeptidase/glutathione hydrolase